MSAPNLIDRLIKARDPQAALVIDVDLRGNPSRLLLAYIASTGADIPISRPIVWKAEELPRQGLIVIHEDSEEAKWHCGSWIEVKSYRTDAVLLQITLLIAAIRHSHETLILEKKADGYALFSPPSAQGQAVSGPDLARVLQSSTFNMLLSAEQARQRRQVELPHLAAQKGHEALPSYDFHDSDGEDGE